jgi:hypothetical protein
MDDSEATSLEQIRAVSGRQWGGAVRGAVPPGSVCLDGAHADATSVRRSEPTRKGIGTAVRSPHDRPERSASSASTTRLPTSTWRASRWLQIYRFRNSEAYRKRNTSYQPARPTPIPIGERRKPPCAVAQIIERPNGKAAPDLSSLGHALRDLQPDTTVRNLPATGVSMAELEDSPKSNPIPKQPSGCSARNGKLLSEIAGAIPTFPPRRQRFFLSKRKTKTERRTLLPS